MNANARRLRWTSIALLFGCLISCFLGITHVSAQTVEDGVARIEQTKTIKVSFAAGFMLPRPGPECFAPSNALISDFYGSVQVSVVSGLAVRAAVEHNRAGGKWPPFDAIRGDDAIVGGSALSVTLEAVLLLRLSRFQVEPFVGLGVNRLLEVAEDRREEAEGDLVLEARTAPLVTYGGTVSYRLTERLDLQAHIRGASVFAGEQGYTINGERFEEDAGRLDQVTFLLGVGIRL